VNLEEVVREMPKNVRIMSVSPSVFNLVKEPVMSRMVPIRSRVDVRTPATHDLVEPPVLDPDSVRVTGAQSIVSQLAFWPTEQRVMRDVKDSVSTSRAGRYAPGARTPVDLHDASPRTLRAIHGRDAGDRREHHRRT
jgi:hypothetical protein